MQLPPLHKRRSMLDFSKLLRQISDLEVEHQLLSSNIEHEREKSANSDERREYATRKLAEAQRALTLARDELMRSQSSFRQSQQQNRELDVLHAREQGQLRASRCIADELEEAANIRQQALEARLAAATTPMPSRVAYLRGIRRASAPSVAQTFESRNAEDLSAILSKMPP
eukprot:Polyplicarium_translucidae@DN2909_c0_g1_i5.p1